MATKGGMSTAKSAGFKLNRTKGMYGSTKKAMGGNKVLVGPLASRPSKSR